MRAAEVRKSNTVQTTEGMENIATIAMIKKVARRVTVMVKKEVMDE